MKIPELTAPAGNFEKLRVACAFGADAVYLAGKEYGLRAHAGNFERGELQEAVAYAHRLNARVYVAVNIFAGNADLERLPEYFEYLEEIGADAVIIADLGVFSVARRALKRVKIHISTQAGVTNYESARVWREMGAERVVLAREVSLAEMAGIAAKLPGFPLECFAHGAMCVSYSGRCLISAFMSGRSANRGDCAQPCRFGYDLTERQSGAVFGLEEDERGSYIMNSKDLCAVSFLPELIEAGASALKLEGRMKTPHYAASVTSAYRRALGDLARGGEAAYRANLPQYLAELRKSPNRAYTSGLYFGPEERFVGEPAPRPYEFIGITRAYNEETHTALVEQRGKFSRGEEIEFLTPGGAFLQTAEDLRGAEGEPIECAPHAQQLVRLKTIQPAPELSILRKKPREPK
ncbi:MAG: U32 family peptidase [Clostridiales bacterium]|jgi:putative protease|nr:U32 family peptidase [Clostridiales bacterium]